MPQSSNTINVCLVGQKFMGRTHSNAFLKVAKFFDPPVKPVMHTICGRNQQDLLEHGNAPRSNNRRGARPDEPLLLLAGCRQTE